MSYEFLREAKAEFWEAAERYESKEAGLGVRFRVEVAHVIERIVADPFLWQEPVMVPASERIPNRRGDRIEAWILTGENRDNRDLSVLCFLCLLLFNRRG